MPLQRTLDRVVAGDKLILNQCPNDSPEGLPIVMLSNGFAALKLGRTLTERPSVPTEFPQNRVS